MYIYIYICVFRDIHVFIYTYICIYTHTYTYAYTYTYTYIYTYIYIHICTWIQYMLYSHILFNTIWDDHTVWPSTIKSEPVATRGGPYHRWLVFWTVSDWYVSATCPDTDLDHLPTNLWTYVSPCIYIYMWYKHNTYIYVPRSTMSQNKRNHVFFRVKREQHHHFRYNYPEKGTKGFSHVPTHWSIMHWSFLSTPW